MNRRAPAAACLAALVCAACGPPLMKLPPAAATPIVDSSFAVNEATAACRAVTTITAEIAASGSIAGHRLRARLLAGLASPASARLEAVAPVGQPLFLFVANGSGATLLLPSEGRVVEHERPQAVLEALTAVPVDAADLRVVLTGCAVAPDALNTRTAGRDWRIVPDGGSDLYLRRDAQSGPWRLVSAVHRRPDRAGAGWRVEYRDFANGLPRTVRLVDLGSNRFDLRLTLSQVELNAPLSSDVFEVRVPANAVPMTLQELEESGPLRTHSGTADSAGAERSPR